MTEAKSLKTGTCFLVNGKPYRVVKYSHQKIARGGGTVKLSARNLETGSLENKTLSSSQKVDEIITQKKPLQLLYTDSANAVFMDTKTYDQVKVPLKTVGDRLSFIKVGENVDVLMWEDRALSVEISPKVILEVSETAPGVKGDSATNVYKPATLENGLELKVPLFIKKADKIRVDTRTGEYVERAK